MLLTHPSVSGRVGTVFRIPSLDGLRAVSISLVVLDHISGSPGFVDLHQLFSWAGAMGALGVRTFFVISGFLITTLLLREQCIYGRISLRDFYIRRAARIFPAFYFFLLVLLVLDAIHLAHLWRFDLLRSATYTIDYFPWWSQSNYVRHIWSLSVEEQFYLIWPVGVVFLGMRRAKHAAILVIALSPLYRLIVQTWIPSFLPTMDRRFDCIADCIATGCVLACVRGQLESNRRYLRFLDSFAFVVVPVAIIFGVWSFNHPKIDYFLGQTAINIALALLIHRSILRPGRFLNARPMVFIGTLSYSLYLWQQVFLSEQSGAARLPFPLNLILAFTMAIFSFYLIEGPMRTAITTRFRSRRSNPVPLTAA